MDEAKGIQRRLRERLLIHPLAHDSWFFLAPLCLGGEKRSFVYLP
jgi:hypothetical protein